MPLEGNKKQGRVPLTSDQIKEIIAFKRLKHYKQVQKLKGTRRYKVLNVFNIISILVYCELIFCMFGPAIYTPHKVTKANADEYGKFVDKKRVVSFMSVWDENDTRYKFYVGESIQTPLPNSVFYVGKDFLLQKEIKVMVHTSLSEYRLWRVVPLIFLGIFVSIITLLVYMQNMNMVNYSLIAISVLNAINLFYFIVV